MVKYIGSKRALLPWILGVVEQISQIEKVETAVDLFSGSGRVGHGLKGMGIFVTSNDLQYYAYILASALVGADAEIYNRARLEPMLAELMQAEPVMGWFTQKYSDDSRYIQPHNAAKIEGIRPVIDHMAAGDQNLRAVLLYSLMMAADKVDSTTGIQMAYLKSWAPRSFNLLRLEYPPLLPGKGIARQGDAAETAKSLEADLIYLDPPYNQHSYLGNYHLWETLALWDNPETYGIAQKRIDVRERKSPYNSKRGAKAAMQNMLKNINAKHLLVSFSNEGFFTALEIEQMLASWGYVARLTKEHQRYVGSRIGIYNNIGEKVGKISHTENKEYLFVATHNKKVIEVFEESAEPTVLV